MKVASLTKAIQKAGLEIAKDGNSFRVSGKGKYYGRFHVQNEDAVCVSTCPINDKPDSSIDYFPQDYHETIKSFINWMTKY